MSITNALLNLPAEADVEDVRKRLENNPIVTAVERLPRGHARIETIFLYPDGSSVDVYVVKDPSQAPSHKLSDLGSTSQWLLDMQVRPWLSKKREMIIEDTTRLYGVTRRGGALELTLDSLAELPGGVTRLGQACVRVADLVYTRRSSLQLPATKELEEVLADAELDYDMNQELEGRFHNAVRVDFVVRGKRTKSAVLTLSSQNSSQAHIQANEIFRRWYDLDIPTRNEQRVTVFDDRYDVYRKEDLSRLLDKSALMALPDRAGICQLLAA